jgi:hypothetical protein
VSMTHHLTLFDTQQIYSLSHTAPLSHPSAIAVKCPSPSTDFDDTSFSSIPLVVRNIHALNIEFQ